MRKHTFDSFGSINLLVWTFVALWVGLTIVLIAFTVVNSFAVNEYTITVDLKEYADDRYLVWDSEGNVYCVEDSILEGRFDSSNDYYQIKEGNTYWIKTRGSRYPFHSMYPNIVEFELVEYGD